MNGEQERRCQELGRDWRRRRGCAEPPGGIRKCKCAAVRPGEGTEGWDGEGPGGTPGHGGDAGRASREAKGETKSRAAADRGKKWKRGGGGGRTRRKGREGEGQRRAGRGEVRAGEPGAEARAARTSRPAPGGVRVPAAGGASGLGAETRNLWSPRGPEEGSGGRGGRRPVGPSVRREGARGGAGRGPGMSAAGLGVQGRGVG